MADITTAQHDQVRLITVDDGKANALSKDLIAGIRAELSAAEADDGTTAVVLAGREGRFSAGFDLSVMSTGEQAEVMDLVSDGGDLVTHLYGASVPVVAACTGHAVAAGALMLLGSDVRVGPDAPVKIGLNEVAIGMVLPGWAMTIAKERLSKRHLQRSIANAQLYDGNGAVDAGFLDMAVEPSTVVDAALAQAEALSGLHPGAYKGTVRSARGEVLAMMTEQAAADRL